MKLLTCMSIAGSIPVVICLLMYLIQHADYNYTLGRRLLITGIFFYLMPVQLIKYLIPKDVFPTSMLITEKLSYIYQVLCPSLQKDRVNIYGCRNGLISYLRYGW